MTKLPTLSGAELVRRLRRLGYEVDRQTGSHLKGTLRAILRHARIPVEQIVHG